VTLKGKQIKQLLNRAGLITTIGGDPNKIQMVLPDTTYIPQATFIVMFAKIRIQTNVWKSSVDCCAEQNIPFVPLKCQKRLGKKPNELTEEILALCHPYFIPCTPQYRSSSKQHEKEPGTGCASSVAYEDLAVNWVQRVAVATFATPCVK